MLLVLLASGLMAIAQPAGASMEGSEEQAMHDYARARLADDDGAMGEAVASYRKALAVDPASPLLALRTYRQAMESGDYALALRAAHALDREVALPPDGTLLLLGDAIKRKQWKQARALTQRISSERNFGFLVPVIESWIALSQGKTAPATLPDDKSLAVLARRYLPEHQALQALALGDATAAMPQIEQALALRANLLPGFRMIAAARLAELGREDAAKSLLDIRNKDARGLRAAIAAGKKPRLRLRTAAQGYARLLFRLSEDLMGESSRTLALAMARTAAFADPACDEYRLQVAQLLLAAEQPAMAMKEIAPVKASSPFASGANDILIAAVLQSGEKDRALAMARAASEAPGADAADFIRLAGMLSRRDEHLAAAEAYQRAMDIFDESPLPWSLHLLKGGSLEQAGRWDDAKAELEKARALAPNEPVILNYLGYAQIERRQNVREALALIQKASGLRPDDPAITDSLGWAHYVNGDVTKAIPVLEKAAAGAPADATVNEHLGDAYWSAGRRFEARYSWNAAYLFADEKAQGRIAKKIELGLHPELAAP